MSISNVIINSGVGQPGWRSTVHQATEDFEQLFLAMQAGNLSDAQQAYSALQQLPSGNSAPAPVSNIASTDPGSAATTPVSGVAAATPPGSITGDWAALGQALQSGDLTSADDAFAKLEQDLQSAAQGLGHRHHHAVENAQAIYLVMQISNTASPSASAPNALAADPAASISSDLNALKQVLQSGDTSSAQDLLAKLEQDLLASGQGSIQHRHHHHGFSVQTPAAAYAGAAVTNGSASLATAGTSPSGSTSA